MCQASFQGSLPAIAFPVITEMAAGRRRNFDFVDDTKIDRNQERAFRECLEAFILEQVDQFEPEIRDQVSACLQAGGKRMRPILLNRAAFTGQTEVCPDLVKASAVVELVHVATLVHDDVLDEAILRRSASTLYSDEGAKVAVLVGDALFSHALRLAADFPTTEICGWVSEATRRTCAGETRQTLQRGKLNLSLENYYRIIELKTAELFRVSCLIGSFLGGFEKAFCNASATFGLRLGIAYQLFDDLADLFGDEFRFGKTLGTDWMNRKPTLPLILLLRELDSKKAEDLWDAKETDVEAIRTLFNERELFETCVERIRVELDLAESAMADFLNLRPVPLLLEAIPYMERKLSELKP